MNIKKYLKKRSPTRTSYEVSAVNFRPRGFAEKSSSLFLSQHNSESILYHLKDLLHKGDMDSCEDLIQLIIAHGHPLAEDVSIYLVGVQVVFEQSESMEEMFAWLEQAKLHGTKVHGDLQSKDLFLWEIFIHTLLALREGAYKKGQSVLETLIHEESVAVIAKYKLAYHLFWKNIDVERACHILEEVCENRQGFIKAWCCLGFVYKKMGLTEKAHETFSHCLSLHKTDAERRKFYKQQLAS